MHLRIRVLAATPSRKRQGLDHMPQLLVSRYNSLWRLISPVPTRQVPCTQCPRWNPHTRSYALYWYCWPVPGLVPGNLRRRPHPVGNSLLLPLTSPSYREQGTRLPARVLDGHNGKPGQTIGKSFTRYPTFFLHFGHFLLGHFRCFLIRVRELAFAPTRDIISHQRPRNCNVVKFAPFGRHSQPSVQRSTHVTDLV